MVARYSPTVQRLARHIFVLSLFAGYSLVHINGIARCLGQSFGEFDIESNTHQVKAYLWQLAYFHVISKLTNDDSLTNCGFLTNNY